jgi:hypothetical protein
MEAPKVVAGEGRSRESLGVDLRGRHIHCVRVAHHTSSHNGAATARQRVRRHGRVRPRQNGLVSLMFAMVPGAFETRLSGADWQRPSAAGLSQEQAHTPLRLPNAAPGQGHQSYQLRPGLSPGAVPPATNPMRLVAKRLRLRRRSRPSPLQPAACSITAWWRLTGYVCAVFPREENGGCEIRHAVG